MEMIIAAVFLFAIVWLYTQNSKPKTPVAVRREPESEVAEVRLTDNQFMCLCAAEFDRPIYGENPSHLYSQMPNDAFCFHLATVKSLERRGFLISDGEGGYLKTKAGHEAMFNRK